MREPTAADLEARERRDRAFRLVVRSRLLQLRLGRARRQTSWLMRRSRYLTKRWNREWNRPYRLPGHVADS